MKFKFWTRNAENPEVPLSSPTALTDLFGDAFIPTGSGIVVTRKRALEVPAYWAGVQFISNTIASLPLKLYRIGSDGNREDDSSSPMGRMLAQRINGSWTSHKWRKWSMQQTLLEGRSLTWIDRQNMRLKPLNVSASAVRTNNLDEVVFDTEGRSFPSADVIDIPWMLDDDGIDHIRPLKAHKETLALAIGLNRYASNFFENGGVPPLALEGPINSPGAADRASNDITQALKRKKNKNILVLPSGHTLKQVGFNPEQGQLIEARRMQIEEIARILNLPPMFLQDLTHGTFSNTEQQDLHFVKHSLTQWLRAWEQEINLKMFPDGRRFVEFNVDGLLRGDFKTRMDGMARAINTAQMTPNEARKKENRPPLEGGDRLYIQGAMVPLEDIDEQGN